MERVILIIKNHSTRGQVMGQLRALGIAYVEAPDLREAFKRLQEEWSYPLVCYDPHGLGPENCHNFEAILSATVVLRQECKFPRLFLIDDCEGVWDVEQLKMRVQDYQEIVGICPLDSAATNIAEYVRHN